MTLRNRAVIAGVGGGSPAAMLHHAAQAVETGAANYVLVCAGENRATGMSRDDTVSALTAVGHPYFEAPYGIGIPSLCALVAQAYMHKYGTTREQMAAAAVNTRNYALMHPNAHMKKPITIEDVLTSKPISDPLNILDCCLISDAGGAFFVTTPERTALRIMASPWPLPKICVDATNDPPALT